jgi:UDP-N-acetylmuramate dehydrogenase
MERFLREELTGLSANPIRWDCPLSDYTSFAIGGPAKALVTVADCRELQALIAFLQTNDVKWQVIGKGTNLLVSDTGFEGVVILLGDGFKSAVFEDRPDDMVTVRVGSGCSVMKLSVLCMQQGCSGFEFACGIPGTIGGAVIMNAGAWGNEMADVLAAVEVVTVEGKKRLSRGRMRFSYRCWLDHAEGTRQVVTEVEIRLKREDPEIVRKRCADLLRMRRQRQPKGLPNAGSFFKNPQGESAGRLIERCGCKGMRVGGAMVSPVHANFVVNTGGATAADVKVLMDIVQKKVREESGVFLEPEVHFL